MAVVNVANHDDLVYAVAVDINHVCGSVCEVCPCRKLCVARTPPAGLVFEINVCGNLAPVIHVMPRMVMVHLVGSDVSPVCLISADCGRIGWNDQFGQPIAVDVACTDVVVVWAPRRAFVTICQPWPALPDASVVLKDPDVRVIAACQSASDLHIAVTVEIGYGKRAELVCDRVLGPSRLEVAFVVVD
uniref:Uncharacterized protein n=1 Tax=Candidatus Methanogaster sp. ANME-2c ERB4 TaxID=2759911 RepID=A0A7G9Y2V4_9EURY|nr:hypothetical protein FCAILLLB_00003 [Methanosarcinales archaeon ANME-2c ERB4]